MTLRCLIVDDSQEFLDAAVAVLKQEGVEVVGTTKSGDEAVRLAGKVKPDVVLADIDMPDESGFDLASRLKAAPSPVILISAHSEEEFADMLESSSAIGFISKAVLSAGEIERLFSAAHHP